MQKAVKRVLLPVLVALAAVALFSIATPDALAAGPVCMIEETGEQFDDVQDAIDALVSGQTIMMLENHDRQSSLSTHSRSLSITFNLNGKTLNVYSVQPTGELPNSALYVWGNSEIKLTGAGEFNVCGQYSGVWAANGAKVTVTNVTGVFNGGLDRPGYCILASNAEVNVLGNVTSDGRLQYKPAAASVSAGAKVTIEGALTGQLSSNYFLFGSYSVNKGPDEYTLPTTKAGYLTYSDGDSAVWVKGTPPTYVCQVVETGVQYTSVQAAMDAPGGDRTIRLLANITQTAPLEVAYNKYTIDLNGKIFNVNAGWVSVFGGAAIVVNNRAELSLTGAGELNCSGPAYGLAVFDYGKATVTNATATGQAPGLSDTARGVYATTGTEATVLGSVTAAGSAETRIGVQAANGARVTVEGTIDSTGDYIVVGGTFKTATDVTLPTTKTGYLTYTDGTSTVWVKAVVSPVCMNVNTGVMYSDFGVAVDAAQSNQTLRLLADINHNRQVALDGKTITIDFRGFVINIVNMTRDQAGLRLVNGSEIRPADNGEISVTGTMFGAFITGGSSVTLMNAEATDPNGVGLLVSGSSVRVYEEVTSRSGMGIVAEPGSYVHVWNVCVGDGVGVYARGSEIIVDGNVYLNESAGTGVEVTEESQVTIEGEILVPSGANYIIINYGLRGQDDYITPTTKAGYLTYTDGDSTVWVRGEPAPATLTDLVIRETPVKLEYTVGERLDITGLQVFAIYSDGSERELLYNDSVHMQRFTYTTSPADGAVLRTTGKQEVTVTYNDVSGVMTRSFTVTVSELKVLYGDVNGDGVVDRADQTLMNQYFARILPAGTVFIMENADVNGDGVVDRADQTRMNQYFSRVDPSPLGPKT